MTTIPVPQQPAPCPPPAVRDGGVGGLADDDSKGRVAPETLGRLDGVILTVAIGVICATTVLLFIVLYRQVNTYGGAISAAISQRGQIDHAAVLAYSRATDFAAAKLSALFLGFLLAFVGAMFVLRVARVDYGLSVANGTSQTFSLNSTSPGLVIVTLGVVLVICVLFNQSRLDYQPPQPQTLHDAVDKAD